LGGLQKRQLNTNPQLKSSSTYLSIGKLKMKRSALIAALLALSLSACGEKPAETAAPVAAAPATEAAAPAAASATEAAAPATEAPQSAAK
jgi:predicted small lipoprotein YifL